MSERILQSHEFWLETCGLDTYQRSANHARLDTPWNAFTKDNRALVCTLWVDTIVDVYDPVEDRNRRFVKLGGKSRAWRGVAIRHGEDAHENLERAVAEKTPVFGYEAEPQPAALLRDERKIKHFYMDRVHQLKGWIGLRLEDLEDRLHIEDAFRRNGIVNDIDSRLPARLFELAEVTDDVPSFGEQSDFGGEHEEEDEIDQTVEDGRTAEEYARIALPLLIAHVLNQKDGVLEPITYRRLAEMLGRYNKHGQPWARGLGHVLVRVTGLIDTANGPERESPPFLTSIVVLSTGTDAGLPGKGVNSRWQGYEFLSREDKQAKLHAEYRRIVEFGSRWSDVLRLVGVPAVELPHESARGQVGDAAAGWGGGESEAHRALKRFVFENPELFGAERDWFAQEEYALRSGDEIDVMFKSDSLWIGVEVKSSVSDVVEGDYERGLYQVVKYRAVLEAQALIDHPESPPEVRVFLGLETELPADCRERARVLEVQYFERLGFFTD